jgi:uncharacterized damage-inducible protein DinB
MAHPLVAQLRFVRSEWLRALDGVNAEDGQRRLPPMNSISWIVGHLAWQEQRYWLTFSQGTTPAPHLNETVGYGKPASTPVLDDMLADWRNVTAASDSFLNAITTEKLQEEIALGRWRTTVGSLLLRVIYHYWYHIGELMAIRQQLGHANLPDFVGDLDTEAPYRPEA